jgi:hypothetical protein
MTTTITKLTITYKSEHKNITSEQFRGAFIDYIRNNFSVEEQTNLPMRYAYNKDENGKQLTGYSLMQYATSKNKLEIVAIGHTSSIIELWLQYILQKDNFTINNKPANLSNPLRTTFYWQAKLGKINLYQLQSWVPFNSDNLGKETLFDKIIWGNIHRMLTDLNIKFDEKVIVNIHEYKRHKKTKPGYKIDWITYDLVFSTNINLPQHIGLGHIVSLGAGKIKKIKVL